MLPQSHHAAASRRARAPFLLFVRACVALIGLALLNGCQCTPNVCGDGEIGAGEQCDDGNYLSGDGCSAFCRLEGARCGDGAVDPGEECDDGNAVSGDGCSTTCRRDGDCGNGAMDPGEECDDGNTAPGDGCSATCTLEFVCGDGVVQAGEECDDGNMTPDDGCEPDCTETPPTEIVCEDLPPLASGVCEVAAGDAQRLLAGVVLTPSTIYHGGRVLLDDQGFITCVGCECDAPSATRITCPQGVISPGLINTHDHITFTQNWPYTPTDERYEHRHDWRRGNDGHTELTVPGSANTAEVRWGELRFLVGGATSTVGSGSATGILRNLDRADQEGLNQPQVHFETFPLGDINGVEHASGCGYPEMVLEAEIETDDAYFPHIAEGIEASARNEFICLHTDPNDNIQPQTAIIHGIGLFAMDYWAMALNGTALIWSPRSNLTLYGDTAVVTCAARMGIPIALGTDWVSTGSMSLLRELRCADTFNTDHLGGFFSDRDLWRMVTQTAAQVTATDDVLGTLEVGKVGDVAIFDGRVRAKHRAIVGAEPQDVVLVLRGGKPLYGDDVVIAAMPGIGACDGLDVCGAAKRVCLADDIGMTLPELETAAGANDPVAPNYPAFFCGDPMNEPLCVPTRNAMNASVNGSTVYTGMTSVDDPDGDGILSAMDNCPTVFNPVRPVDDGLQADFDGDGEGDACDVCPMDPFVSVCSTPNPDDNDNDGTLNADDNCPNHANPDQADGDQDGKGDACDACPADANPGTAGCPATIYEIKDGTVPEGRNVALASQLVTGVYADGFFLQVKPGDADYISPDYSGIFVYSPGHTVLVGDRVSLSSAIVSDYFGQIQLDTQPIAITVVQSMGEASPDPVVVAPADIATGGIWAAALEGVIVEVQDVSVIALETMYNEFFVTDNLRVNDLLYLASPFPSIGDDFAVIRGILEFRNDNSKIEPRGPQDLVPGPPKLVSFGPALSYVYVGQTGVPTVPVPLTVTLSYAPMMDTFVTVTSPDPALVVVGGGVTVPAGMTSAQVLVDGVSQAQAVTLSADLDSLILSADVRVLDPAELPLLAALDPPAVTLPPGGMTTFTVTLDLPSPPGDTIVDLAVSPPGAGTLPATVMVPAGQVSATFDYTDLFIGPAATVTATLGASMLSATIDVVVPMGSLVINEVDYDQTVNPDGFEYVEIYNGTGAPVDLTGKALVLVNGSNNTVYNTVDLAPAGTLAPGQYLVVGSTAVTVPMGALKIDFAGGQTDRIQNGSPDGIALVDTVAGTLLDALSYEGSITMVTIAGVGMVSLVEGTALPGAVADSNSVVGSLCRLPNGADTNDAATDWAFSANITPGAANVP